MILRICESKPISFLDLVKQIDWVMQFFVEIENFVIYTLHFTSGRIAWVASQSKLLINFGVVQTLTVSENREIFTLNP